MNESLKLWELNPAFLFDILQFLDSDRSEALSVKFRLCNEYRDEEFCQGAIFFSEPEKSIFLLSDNDSLDGVKSYKHSVFTFKFSWKIAEISFNEKPRWVDIDGIEMILEQKYSKPARVSTKKLIEGIIEKRKIPTK